MFAPKVAKPLTKTAADAANSLARSRSPMTARPQDPLGELLFLQRSIDNQATLRHLAQRTASSAAGESSGDHMQEHAPENTLGGEAPRGVSWAFSKIPLFPPDKASRPQPSSTPVTAPLPGAIQAKLVVGQVSDPLEHEADRVADEVMRMRDPDIAVTRTLPKLSRKCADCEEEGAKVQTKRVGAPEAAISEAPNVVHEVVSAPGRPLDQATRSFFEPRFGRSFSKVRTHTDANAAASARAVNAIAYTVGSDIVFAEGRYEPKTEQGGRLLAHELAHTLQQSALSPSAAPYVQRTAATCPAGWKTKVGDDHTRALGMLDTARTKLSSYDGTSPPEVKTALDKHFKANSTGFAGWVNLNLGYLRLVAPLASYDCEDTSSWWCGSPTQAKTFWCVPLIDIRVCQPLYFSEPDLERSRILIHEWVHKYGCNFDLGYQHDKDYPQQWTITALLNADPFARFVRDVQ